MPCSNSGRAALPVDVLDPQQEAAARDRGPPRSRTAPSRRGPDADSRSGWARTASPAAARPRAGTGRKSVPLIMPALRVLGPWPSPIGLSAAVRPDHDRRRQRCAMPRIPQVRSTTWRSLSGPSVAPSAGGPPRQLVVLLHGVGADGHDLIGLAPMLAERLPHALFVAPDGPSPATWHPTVASGSACRTAGRPSCWPAPGGRRHCSTPISTELLAAPRPRRGRHGSGRLLPGHHDVAVRGAAPRRARWPRSWASPARCWARRSCRARHAAGRR